jgi:hypothetical protein
VRIRSLTIALSVVCALSVASNAQDSDLRTFSGVVRDADGPLSGVHIQYDKLTLVTDETGQFSLNLPRGNARVVLFEHATHDFAVRVFMDETGSSTDQNIVLTPHADCPSGDAGKAPAALQDSDFLEIVYPGGMLSGFKFRMTVNGEVSYLGGGSPGTIPVFPVTTRISAADSRELIDRFIQSGFWSLCYDYRKVSKMMITDRRSVIATIRVGNKIRRVSSYDYGAPAWLEALIEEADKLVDTSQWRSGPQRTAAIATIARTTNLNALDSNGWNALMYAIHQHDDAQSRIADLRRRGADPNVRSSRNESPLMLAAAAGSAAWVKALIAAGADVHARGPGGETALLAAIHAGGLLPREDIGEIVSMLRGAGARVDVRDDSGMRALDYLEQDMKRSPKYNIERFDQIRRSLQ